jgi:hypothetical protein
MLTIIYIVTLGVGFPVSCRIDPEVSLGFILSPSRRRFAIVLSCGFRHRDVARGWFASVMSFGVEAPFGLIWNSKLAS